MLLVGDRALLLRFRSGEREALETVYMEYAPHVASFLRGGFGFQSGARALRFRGARSQFDLEDRLHDVFGRAFSENARLGYDGLSPYRVYLLTIARNIVIDDFRRKEHALFDYSIDDGPDRASAWDGDATEPLAGEVALTGDPERDAQAQELVSLVTRFKDALPPREREVFRLRFEEEKEHREIARALGLSPSKIKTSEARIRTQFFEFMKSHGYFKGFVQKRHGWLSALRSL